MINTSSPLSRVVAKVVAVTMLNLALPAGFAGIFPERHGLPDGPKPKAAPSRLLGSKEQKQLQGKTGQNPYLAGSTKFSTNMHGVDLLTKNFTFSVKDLDFEGGYGIPVSVERTYSANNPDEGPMGVGWTLSVDLRSTAGGILKSKGAPSRQVPVHVHERPSTEADPNMATQPVEAVTETDASGKEETIQKDADGILSAPAWDQNKYEPVYDIVDASGNHTTSTPQYRILTGQKVTTPEGTVYVYAKEGSFQAGVTSLSNSSASAEPSNILKVTSVTDRQGNATNYSYSSTTATFARGNGSATENELTQIAMPNGHQLNFAWTGNRITSVSDNSGTGTTRTVTYGYTNGMLTGVTDPAGLLTQYGYGGAGNASGNVTDVAGLNESLMTSITDPRGLVRSIEYQNTTCTVVPYCVVVNGVAVAKVTEPNGVRFFICGVNDGLFTDSEFPTDMGDGAFTYNFCSQYRECSGSPGSYTTLTNGCVGVTLDQTSRTLGVKYVDSGVNVPSAGGQAYTYPGSGHVLRTFDALTQNLLAETVFNMPYAYAPDGHAIDTSGEACSGVETDTTYNMFGHPLHKVITEYTLPGPTVTRTTNMDYAYWGASKYYQQKATKDNAGRYTFTEYSDNQASAGSKGQVLYNYDPKYGGIALDTSQSAPSGTPSYGVWRYQVYVPSAYANCYASKLQYDSSGRATDVWKLHGVGTIGTSSTYGYVQTHTTYGADGSGSWGEPYQVVEDYGTGCLNRTTTTTAFDSAGRATSTTDGAAHSFSTVYDADGKIQSVARTDVSPSVTLTTYGYGTSDISKGAVTSVTDGLSGVTDSITYQSAAGGGRGQPSSVQESTNQTANYTLNYTYTAAGDRSSVEYYVTGGSDNKWLYDNYVSVGTAGNFKRMFQTFCKLDSSGNHTPEEMHYTYDTAGHLRAACFAQTPDSTYSPTGGATYYPALGSSSHLATTRARAYYSYDPGGRLSTLNYWWDTANTSTTYSSSAITGCSYSYDSTTGLRTGATFTDSVLNTSRTEAYAYDSSLDYLTSANYNDGLSNATDSWTYDAGGNRSSDAVNSGTWSYNSLDMMTAAPAGSYSNDTVGNRLTAPGSTSMTWDCLNRLTQLQNGSGTWNYTYRADGMRVLKSDGGSNSSAYRYDGQMGFEDVDTTSSGTTTTDYGFGARGIDWISNGGVAFPVYDGHGNMLATLAKSGSSFAIANRRSFDAWGALRSGSTSGDPKGRYCASIGHKHDDESGLVYMRARYYEPSSGRFVSEDAEPKERNLFIYASNSPVSHFDRSGHEGGDDVWWATLEGVAIAVALAVGVHVGQFLFEKMVEQAISEKSGGGLTQDGLDLAMSVGNSFLTRVALEGAGVGLMALLVATGELGPPGPARLCSSMGIAFVCGLLIGFMNDMFSLALQDMVVIVNE